MNYYNEIKNELINNEIYKKAKDYSKNRNDLNTYYNVGKLLFHAGKHYGENIISQYSKKLVKDINKNYNNTFLKRVRKFFSIIQNGATLSHQLTWSHYVELLPLNDINKVNYYVNIIKFQNISIRQLREKIKNNEYERLDNDTKLKLINNEKTKIEDFIKNPITIKNKFDTTDISEKMLKQLILEDMDSFLKELGKGF